MVSHFSISATRFSSSCPCVGYVFLAESDIVFNLFHGLENLINILKLFFRLLKFHVTSGWRWGGGKSSWFSVWLCSYIWSFIKRITVSKKTLCDLEVHVLTAHTLGGVGAGSRQCLGQSVSEQPLRLHCEHKHGLQITLCACSESNSRQSQNLNTYTGNGRLGFWCCWKIHTHLAETAWIHELLEAEGELSLGSRGEEQGRVTHMGKLFVLKQGEHSQFAFEKILPCFCLETHCPGAQDTCSALCQAGTLSYAF